MRGGDGPCRSIQGRGLWARTEGRVRSLRLWSELDMRVSFTLRSYLELPSWMR